MRNLIVSCLVVVIVGGASSAVGCLNAGDDCSVFYDCEAATIGNTSGGGMTGGGGNTGEGGTMGSGGNTSGGGTAGAGGAAGVCGNGTKEAGEECDDGNSDDGDGCSSVCVMDGGISCEDAIEVDLELGMPKILNGTTVNGGASSENPACPSGGYERIYHVTAGAAGFLTASLTRSKANFNSSLYIRGGCGAGGIIACADSTSLNGEAMYHGGEVISVAVQDYEVMYIFVNGVAKSDQGDYELVLDLSTGFNCDDPLPIPIEAGTPMMFLGSTNGNGADASCDNNTLGSQAEDVVYEVTFPNAGIYQFSIIADYNSVVYSQTQCGDTSQQIQCSDDSIGGEETLEINVAESGGDVKPGERAYIWIDGIMGTEGNYSLAITPPP